MSLERKDVADTYDLLIDGESTPAAEGGTLTTYNPATEEELATVAAATEVDVDRAVESAREAFEEMQERTATWRGQRLQELADLVRENADRLARLETLDNGKPLSQGQGGVHSTARYLEYYGGHADKIQGDSLPVGPDSVDFTVREPLGVTGHIIPWNFPISMFGRSVAAALAAGNTAVVKPAEQTPLTAIEVGKLAVEAGFPPGTINVIPGFGAEAGAPLAGHPDVDGVSFTGSVVTGKSVAKLAVDNVTPVHLELGGKSPNVVFPDADLENAVDHAVRGITTNAGQVCSAASRLLVHEDVHDEVVDRVADRFEDLELGPGIDDPDMGPLVSEEQFDKVTNYLEIGREEAGEPITGGSAPDRTGHFVEPTIFDEVDNSSRIAQEEIFGPVLSVITFSDEDEAIELANDVDYGLVAGVHTSDVGRAHRFARDVDAGQVYINQWFGGGVQSPFGGYKQSGFGREAGLEAIKGYTQVKTVNANIDL